MTFAHRCVFAETEHITFESNHVKSSNSGKQALGSYYTRDKKVISSPNSVNVQCLAIYV